jgi:hypothetical protein
VTGLSLSLGERPTGLAGASSSWGRPARGSRGSPGSGWTGDPRDRRGVRPELRTGRRTCRGRPTPGRSCSCNQRAHGCRQPPWRSERVMLRRASGTDFPDRSPVPPSWPRRIRDELEDGTRLRLGARGRRDRECPRGGCAGSEQPSPAECRFRHRWLEPGLGSRTDPLGASTPRNVASDIYEPTVTSRRPAARARPIYAHVPPCASMHDLCDFPDRSPVPPSWPRRMWEQVMLSRALCQVTRTRDFGVQPATSELSPTR